MQYHHSVKRRHRPLRVVLQADIGKCPFVIFMQDHYRPDGSCLCSNSAHRKMMIAEWEYSDSDFTNIPLID